MDRPPRTTRPRWRGRLHRLAGIALTAATISGAAPAVAQDAVGPGMIDVTGFVGIDSGWEIVTSGSDLSDVDLLTGALLPSEAFAGMNAAEALGADLASADVLAFDAQNLAEQARLDAERRRLAALAGEGRLGPEVPYAELFNTIAPRYGLDPFMVAAVAYVESNFDEDVVRCRRVSRAGARGIMQLMPATAQGLGVDPCEPGSAIEGGSRRLADLHRRYGNWELVFAAYNAGPGNVDRHGGIPPFTRTRAYVPKVMERWNHYRNLYGGSEDGRMEDGPGGVKICVTSAAGFEVACHIAGPVKAMVADAAADGVRLTGSAYRSHQRQIELRRQNCGGDVWSRPASSCRPPTAVPGRSLHERGEAIDFANCSTRGTACHQWLARNASRYGFRNLPSEPWHWSTTGK